MRKQMFLLHQNDLELQIAWWATFSWSLEMYMISFDDGSVSDISLVNKL